MKIKQIIPAVLACATVVACNGGGNSGPAADTAQYGKLVSASEQKLINLSIGPLNLSGSSYLAAGLVAAIVGNYVSSDTASIITYVAGGGQTSAESQQANNLNTNTIYNYSPFQKFIANNMVDLNNPLESITSYAIKYTTPGQNSGTQVNQIVRTASGMIIMPSASSTQFQNKRCCYLFSSN